MVHLLQHTIDGASILAKIKDNITYNDITNSDINNVLTLIYYTGYLTKDRKSSLSEQGSKIFELKIPNKEITEIFKNSFFDVVKNIVKQKILTVEDKKIDELLSNLLEGYEDMVTEILTSLLSESISYFDYNEAFYHAYLLGLISSKISHTISNREAGLGRSDLQVLPKNISVSMIIEVKRVQQEKFLLKSASLAIEQIIKNNYDFESRKKYDKIVLWGISFYQKKCLAKAKIITSI